MHKSFTCRQSYPLSLQAVVGINRPMKPWTRRPCTFQTAQMLWLIFEKPISSLLILIKYKLSFYTHFIPSTHAGGKDTFLSRRERKVHFFSLYFKRQNILFSPAQNENSFSAALSEVILLVADPEHVNQWFIRHVLISPHVPVCSQQAIPFVLHAPRVSAKSHWKQSVNRLRHPSCVCPDKDCPLFLTRQTRRAP